MPTISERFRIKNEDAELRLRLDVGSGQIAGFAMLLDSAELTPATQDPVHAEYTLGRGADLRFSLLIGTVKVQDVSPITNQTTITATVWQGDNRRIFKDQAEAPQDGVVSYGIALAFE